MPKVGKVNTANAAVAAQGVLVRSLAMRLARSSVTPRFSPKKRTVASTL